MVGRRAWRWILDNDRKRPGASGRSTIVKPASRRWILLPLRGTSSPLSRLRRRNTNADADAVITPRR